MPYAHTTYTGLKTSLSERLADTAKTFWTDTELGLYLTEALRTFGLLSGFWRARGALRTIANTVFYDITTQTYGSPTLQALLGSTVTDRDIIQQLQYHLVESASDQTQWLGTEQFIYNDIVKAVQQRLNQFLADTGIVVTRSLVAVASPPIGRQQLTDTIIDIRRAAWLGASPLNYYVPLWREDERTLTAANQGWSVNPDGPDAYSILGPPPLQLQLSPIPVASGQLELLTVSTGTALNPASSATALGIPDDLAPAIKWGALADLLGKDGIARDPVRAYYCEQRYQIYVRLARVLPVILHAGLNGVPLIPATLQEMDAAEPNWESVTASPFNPVADVIIAAPNLIALNPVPDTLYSVTLDVVRKTPTYSDADQVQIGREQLDAILDYAEHLALFKVGGAEWHSSERQANNFLIQ